MVEPFSRRIVCLLLLPVTWLAGELACAQVVPAGGTPPQKPRPCVLLQNNNVLFGTAQQRGDLVMVHKDDGSTIQLKRKDVACWADSLRGLYRYRADQRTAFGAATHQELTDWCLRYDLLDLAARELQAAYRIDPDNPRTNQLARQLLNANDAIAAQPLDPTKPAQDAPQIQLSSHEVPVEPTFSPPQLRVFARHVQPLLINRCGKCHSHQSSRRWQLQVPARGSRASARITQTNLAATMPYINTDDAAASELRGRAVDGHAGKSGTLGPRAVAATRALDVWLRTVRRSEPAKRGDSKDARDNAEVRPAAHSESAEPKESEPGGIKRLPVVSNPFDPEIFNRQVHGNK